MIPSLGLFIPEDFLIKLRCCLVSPIIVSSVLYLPCHLKEVDIIRKYVEVYPKEGNCTLYNNNIQTIYSQLGLDAALHFSK